MSTRKQLAHLGGVRLQLSDLDRRAAEPAPAKAGVKELATLAFVAEASNLLLLGPPGVGKTHLAVALALRSIEKPMAPTSCVPTT